MNIQTFCRSTFLLLVFPTSMFAAVTESAVCVRDGITRTVELRVEGGSGVPCNVTYLRTDNDGDEERLWSAQNDASYCVEKYEGFLVRLENKLNWSCMRQVGAPLVDAAIAKENLDLTEAQVLPRSLSSDETLSAELSRPKPDSQLTSPVTPEPLQRTGPPINHDTQAYLAALNSSETVIGTLSEDRALLPEPTLEAAIPVFQTSVPLASRTNFEVDLTESATVTKPLDFDTVRLSIPSGYYSQASNPGHQGDEAACPADGYFVWNTQDSERPVFEMGPVLEFATRFNNVNLVDQMRIDTLVADISSIGTLADANQIKENTTPSSAQAFDNCLASVHYSYCEGPQIRHGEGHWGTNNTSFRCDTNATRQTSGTPLFALFQNRIIPQDIAGDCAAAQPISHMALRPVIAINASEPSSVIELVVTRNSGTSSRSQRRVVCRYTRS